MTSASELFYNRRSRFARNNAELGLDSYVDRVPHHNHINRRHHNHISRRDSEPLRRSSNPTHRDRPYFQELESIILDQGSSNSASGNGSNLENFGSIRNRQRFGGNDRLPGAVLLARERLLERLRGVSSSGNRQTNRASSGIQDDEFTLGGRPRSVGPEEWLIGVTPSTDHLLGLQETRKHPPGLTQEALDCLGIEVFSNKEKCVEKREIFRECSICLESFLEGDELICLPCGHRFHSCCLDPWVRTCGDCPNCRTSIVV